jgi:hypothetical protein
VGEGARADRDGIRGGRVAIASIALALATAAACGGRTAGGTTGAAAGDGGVECALKDGTYLATSTGMSAPDSEGGGCASTSNRFVVPSEGGAQLAAGCQYSSNHCVVTCDSTTDDNGNTTTIHSTLSYDADGTGYSGTFTVKTTSDDGGAVIEDCMFALTATLQ